MRPFVTRGTDFCTFIAVDRWLGVLLLGLTLGGCSPNTTIAVDNMGAMPQLLRVVGGGGSRAWLVPPGTAGLGPTFLAEDRPFVLITTLDCKEVARFAPAGGRQTIVIEESGVAPQLHDGIDEGLRALTATTDPCPLIP